MKIEICNASVGYSGKALVSGISMVSEGNDITAVLGKNGCGKTTFVKSLIGNVPWLDGEVFIDGEKIKYNRKFWKIASYVSQDVDNVPYSVMDMVLLGTGVYKGLFSQPDEKDRKKVKSVLEKLNMERYSDMPYSVLSRGQKQLVKIARALVSAPQLLIMDEPESGLDMKNMKILLELIKKISKEDGRQVLFITHNPQHALMVADKALLFVNGKALWGDRDDILTKENLEYAYEVELSLLREDSECAVTFRLDK